MSSMNLERYYSIAQCEDTEDTTEAEVLAAIAEVSHLGDGYTRDEHRGGGHSDGSSTILSLRNGLHFRLSEIRKASKFAEIRSLFRKLDVSYTVKFDSGASRTYWVDNDNIHDVIIDILRWESPIVNIVEAKA